MCSLKIYMGRDRSNELPTCLIRKMFKMRADVFNNRSGWSLPLTNGLEIDKFDNSSTVYVLCYDSILDEVVACWRALPALPKCMLTDVFPELLGGRLGEINGQTWELSRFAVAKGSSSGVGVFMKNSDLTRNMFAAIRLFAYKNGIDDFITVTSPSLYRLLKFNGLTIPRIDRLSLSESLGLGRLSCRIVFDGAMDRFIDSSYSKIELYDSIDK